MELSHNQAAELYLARYSINQSNKQTKQKFKNNNWT